MTVTVVVVMLSAGFAARTLSVRWARTTSDLFAAIQPPSPGLLGAGLAAEHLSAPFVVCAVVLGAGSGPAGAWLAIAVTAGLAALGLVAAAPIRRSGLVATPGDVAVALWSDARLATWLHRGTLVVVVLLLVPVVQVATRSVQAVSPLPSAPAAAAAGGLLAGAVTIFQGRGSLYAQPVRLAALAVGLLAVAGSGVPDRVESSLGLALHLPGRLSATAWVLAAVTGTITAPQLWPRLQAARDPHAARQAVVVATGIVGLLALVALVVGSRGARGEPGGVLPTAPERLALGLFVGGLLSGCLATGSALLLAGVAAARRLGLGSRRALLTVATASVGLALAWHDAGLVAVTGWAFMVAAALSSPIVAAGLWWRAFSPQGARWAAATGTATAITAIAVSWGVGPAGGNGSGAVLSLACLPAAVVAGVLGSLIQPSDAGTGREVAARLRFHRPPPGL